MLPEIEPLATVVVCEDDELTRELLVENLEADRFHALAAPTASDALRFCRFSHPDALLLDLSLPDAPGLDVLRRIREADGPAAEFDPQLPVIVVTGRAAAEDRVRGLREGASEYLTKPFHYEELLLRLRRLVDERNGVRRGPIRVGALTVDPATRRVRVGEREVELPNKEFELLRMLASAPSTVFTKAELLQEVWGYQSVGKTRTLDSHASRLRRKLDPERGRFVVNVWGVGYKLVEGP